MWLIIHNAMQSKNIKLHAANGYFSNNFTQLNIKIYGNVFVNINGVWTFNKKFSVTTSWENSINSKYAKITSV